MEVIGEFQKGNSSASNSTTGLIFLNRIEAEWDTGRTDNGVHVNQRILISTSFDDWESNQEETRDKGNQRKLSTGRLLNATSELAICKEQQLTTEIFHASLVPLNSTESCGKYYGVLALVQRIRPSLLVSMSQEESFSASIFLLESSSASLIESNIVETLDVVKPQTHALHLHLMRANPVPIPMQSSLEEVVETLEDESESLQYKLQLLVLLLNEGVVTHTIEVAPCARGKSKIEMSSFVRVNKNIWWAEWNPRYQFLAFAHSHKRYQSVLESENEDLAESNTVRQTQSTLSVFQFHDQFQRETVINFPLDSVVVEEARNLWCSMISSPLILSSNNHLARSLRLLTHSGGNVCLFYLRKPDQLYKLSYTAILLAHNKTLNVDVEEDSIKTGNLSNDLLDVDVCFSLKGQYLIVLAWPHSLHILDIGVTHDPSHHFVFPLEAVFPELTTTSEFQSCFQLICPRLTDDESCFHLLLTDLTVQSIGLNASFFLSIVRKLLSNEAADINLMLATIHSLLIHFNSPNSVKAFVAEIVQKVDNLHLTKLFQEFIIAHAHATTVKDLLPNMKSFLLFLPYCQTPSLGIAPVHYIGRLYKMKLETTPTKLSTILLSPNQRIFSHHVSDVWTSLWESNTLLMASHRFCHQKIADKLLLSLQCYKPEALSRASTPMSPLSPMVCGSLNDIATMFARRNQDLQLPFVEHESCTANKQEYIFSINLRELSMHLLKERRDWPLACHTIAGKYVNALTDASRLLCHLISLTTIPQLQRPLRPKEKGFSLIDSCTAAQQLNLFILLEHFTLAHGKLATPLPQGFTPFFAYLGYRVLRFEQFLWHVRCGTFDLQIDMVKNIMSDLSDLNEKHVEKKLQLILFLPKSRASRVLNGWSHPISIGLRARQHASDLLSGAVSTQSRKFHFSTQVNRVRSKTEAQPSERRLENSPLDTFFRLLTAKANATDIDLGLLTEATMLSMSVER